MFLFSVEGWGFRGLRVLDHPAGVRIVPRGFVGSNPTLRTKINNGIEVFLRFFYPNKPYFNRFFLVSMDFLSRFT